MMNVYFVVTATPRGLNIKAQGRAYSRHPGNALKIHVNPNGVEQGCVANVVMCNPVGVDASLTTHPGWREYARPWALILNPLGVAKPI